MLYRVTGDESGGESPTDGKLFAKEEMMATQDEEMGLYERAIQEMEEDDEFHSTILRYCSDVLGSVRRDELNRLEHTKHTS